MQNESTEAWSTMRCERLTARPGQREALVAVLRRGAQGLKSAGCDLHVSLSQDHPDVVWVTQVWTSREARRASLGLPTVKRALAEAMPLLTDEVDHAELSAVGP